MKVKILVSFIFMAMALSANTFADVNFTLEITGIEVNRGKIYVDLFSNADEYRKVIPYHSFVLESTTSRIVHRFDIAEGEYVIAIYQDTNDSGEMETSFFGMPREPFAISNYRGGIPISFNRLKYPINNSSNRITLSMGRE